VTPRASSRWPRHQPAAGSRDRWPRPDCGAARTRRIAPVPATGHRPAPGLRRLRPAVPPAGAAPQSDEHLPRARAPLARLREEVLDAEVVHAIAPRAALTIVLVNGTSLDSTGPAAAASVAALRLGATESGIISLSPAGQIGGEHCVA